MSYLYNCFMNILTSIVCLFIRRDKRILLFGSWMGRRYADNSRCLYEFLSKNKKAYGLKKVIWVTDNPKVVKMLNENGFEAYRKNTIKGVYWHFKSGVHIVSNTYSSSKSHNGDIIGHLSCGAIKILLWHGLSIKACGKMRADINNNHSLKHSVRNFLNLVFSAAFFSPGCWKNRFHLTTAPESTRVAYYDFGVKRNHAIEASYPRLNYPSFITKKEKRLLEKLDSLRKKHKLILYCPTFREMNKTESRFVNPILQPGFMQFIENNNYIWIDKRHSANTFSVEKIDSPNVMYIDSDFDINLIYRYIDILVTDYSSTAAEAVYFSIPVVSFIPDYDQYNTQERGLVSPYDSYYPGEKSYTTDELKMQIKNASDYETYFVRFGKKYDQCKRFLFNDNPKDMNWIYNRIKEKAKF